MTEVPPTRVEPQCPSGLKDIVQHMQMGAFEAQDGEWRAVEAQENTKDLPLEAAQARRDFLVGQVQVLVVAYVNTESQRQRLSIENFLRSLNLQVSVNTETGSIDCDFPKERKFIEALPGDHEQLFRCVLGSYEGLMKTIEGYAFCSFELLAKEALGSDNLKLGVLRELFEGRTGREQLDFRQIVRDHLLSFIIDSLLRKVLHENAKPDTID